MADDLTARRVARDESQAEIVRAAQAEFDAGAALIDESADDELAAALAEMEAVIDADSTGSKAVRAAKVRYDTNGALTVEPVLRPLD